MVDEEIININIEPKEIKQEKKELQNVTKCNIEQERKDKWEKHLNRKILTNEEYSKINKKASIISLVWKFLIIIILGLVVWQIFAFNYNFKGKDFTPEVSTPVTVNPASVQVPVNVDNNPNIYLNVTVNIDKIIAGNSS